MYHTAFLLRGTDLLDRQGLAATWRLFPSGPDIISAMQRGDLDLGYIGLPPVIIGIDKRSLPCLHCRRPCGRDGDDRGARDPDPWGMRGA